MAGVPQLQERFCGLATARSPGLKTRSFFGFALTGRRAAAF